MLENGKLEADRRPLSGVLWQLAGVYFPRGSSAFIGRHELNMSNTTFGHE